MSAPKDTKDVERAQAAFHKKEAQAREGATAMAEYVAAGHAERAKTERLRALRLAKEAAEREAALNAPPPPPKLAKVPAGALKTAKAAKGAKMKATSKTKAPAKKKK